MNQQRTEETEVYVHPPIEFKALEDDVFALARTIITRLKNAGYTHARDLPRDERLAKEL